MNLEYFLKQRTKYIKFFYKTGIISFIQIMKSIEDEKPPYQIKNYSYEQEEPPFLDEWLDARTGVFTIGHSAISMLSSSMKLFLNEWKKRLETYYKVDFKIDFRDLGWFPGFLAYISKCGIDLNICPANLELLEQIALCRNNIQHPDKITSINVKFTKKDILKYPRPYFLDPIENIPDNDSWAWAPDVKPSENDIYLSITNVELFCSWLDKEYFN